MDNQPPAVPSMDIAPALKLYLESIESWKENYKKLLENTDMQPAANQNPFAESYNQALANWQSASGELYRRFIDDQVELCRFLSHRWESYRDLPRQVTHCRNPAELAQLQIDFMTRMMSEYAHESMKLMQPINDVLTKYSAGNSFY